VVPIAGVEASKNTKFDNAANRQMRSIASEGKLDASNATAMGFTVGSVVEKNNKDQHTTQKYKIKHVEEYVAIVVSLTEPDTELTLDYAKLIEHIVNKSAKAKVSIRNNTP
jgi:hypothetical protein